MASVIKEIVVNVPVERAYAFWKNFENFPSFMENIESVRSTGSDLSHWKSKGPLGTSVEWDAQVISAQENKKIAWQSVDGTIETHGAVTFERLSGDQTRIVVGLEYNPPAGASGEAVAKIFSDPEKFLEEDLQRLKQVLESGEAENAAATSAVRDGSYINTVSSSQREGKMRGSGSGADEHSETREV